MELRPLAAAIVACSQRAYLERIRTDHATDNNRPSVVICHEIASDDARRCPLPAFAWRPPPLLSTIRHDSRNT